MSWYIGLYSILLMSVLAHADSEQLILGGVTYHVINQENEARKFSNKLSNDGTLILTPTIGYSKTKDLPYDEYASQTLFLVLDSVGQPASGGLFQWGYVLGRWRLGLVLGAYAQNDWEFHHRGIAPFECLELGNIGLVPVGGGAINYRVPLRGKSFFEFNNIITPVITSHVVSIGKEF